MALELSVKADLLRQETNIEQQLIVQVDGIPFIYGAVTVTKLALYGDDIFYGDAGLVYGGITPDPDGRAYISLENTTRQLSQQLEIDKGGTGSVQKFSVSLIDKNQEVTKALQPGNYIPDVLGREANVFLAFQGGSHPEDSVRIFNGIVTGQSGKPGLWTLSIDHPEFLKRQDLFQQVTSQLDGSISSGATSLVLDSVDNLISPQDAVTTYIQIGDEIIQYASIDTGTKTLSGLTRGALNTVAAAHSDGDDSKSFYQITGNPIELALKIMLSNPGNTPFKTGVSAERFKQVTATDNITNGVYFSDLNLKDNLGLELGDLLTVSGASNPANNFTDAAIAAFLTVSTGTVIVVSGPTLETEIGSSALASFKSKWNTLPAGTGCSMKPSQVDVANHNKMLTLFPTLPGVSPYIKDTINAKEFLADQLYKPLGFYQVPRKGRASVSVTLPPLVLEELVELNSRNVKSFAKNRISRQITKNFFNNVAYKFNRDSLTDKFLAGTIVISNRSQARINTGNKTLTIESDGLRDTPEVRTFIASQARRFADRYQFAAESIKVETKYSTGFTIEIADVVLFGADSQLPDLAQGNRNFRPRLMEVVNKSLDIRGKVELELLDTGFGIDGRFGVISPNSFIGLGSSTTNIVLKASFGTGEFEIERNKWENFIGESVRIRNTDFTFSETVRLIQFDPSSLDRIIVNPALSSAPPEDYILDLPDYNADSNADTFRKMKTIHCFHNPQVTITAGISNTVFEVGAGDINKFLVDAFVRVHTDDYSVTSTPGTIDDDIQVLSVDIILNRVTVGDMGFTPASGYKVDLIGFKDGGLPYRII